MAARTSVNQPYQPRPIKFLFEYNKAWTAMLENDPNLRDVEVAEVTKMLACGKLLLGGKRVVCENESSLKLECTCLSGLRSRTTHVHRRDPTRTV